MKIISVPLSLEAMQRLDFDACIEGDLMELELSQSQFDSCWEIGLFQSLNSRLGLLIDEYEDEVISKELIQQALEILDCYLQNNNEEADFLKRIRELFVMASERQTGIFLFF